jgi:hypothetical protein
MASALIRALLVNVRASSRISWRALPSCPAHAGAGGGTVANFPAAGGLDFLLSFNRQGKARGGAISVIRTGRRRSTSAASS